MKVLSIKNYNSNMGVLIDIRNPFDYQQNHHKDAINIYYERLMYNPTKYLNKNTRYFLVCEKGILSDKTVKYLSYLGYDVTKIIK